MSKTNKRGLLQILKDISIETYLSQKPTDFSIGIVMNVEPLQIKIDGGTVLPADFFILSKSVTRYTDQQDRIIDNRLIKGESVILARKMGGQKYFVIDKVGVAS